MKPEVTIRESVRSICNDIQITTDETKFFVPSIVMVLDFLG
jgi:hypothetical protein